MSTQGPKDRELNLKGLAINFLIAVIVAALHNIRILPNGGYGFDTGMFLQDGGLVFAFGNIVGFFTHAHVPVGGQQGVPGESLKPPSETPK